MSTPESDIRPPIPASCADRPLVGGVVAPWANVQLADGSVDFRSHHNTKAEACWRDNLCQLCGNPLRHPIVMLGGPNQLRDLVFHEPPLHPECAVYASKACPMVAGRLTDYASRDVVANGPRGAKCYDPGCDCGGWVPTPGNVIGEGGDPNHDWFAVYVSGFSLAVRSDRRDRIDGAVCSPSQVLVVRQVSSVEHGRVWKRIEDPLTGYVAPEVAS